MYAEESKTGMNYAEEKASKRGRVSKDDWQEETRFVLRHLDDPITLQGSKFCRFDAVKELALVKYSDCSVPRGLVLHEISMDVLREIEAELNGYAGVIRLKEFTNLTRQGMGVARASRAMGITTGYAHRSLKRKLVELFTVKLMSKLH